MSQSYISSTLQNGQDENQIFSRQYSEGVESQYQNHLQSRAIFEDTNKQNIKNKNNINPTMTSILQKKSSNKSMKQKATSYKTLLLPPKPQQSFKGTIQSFKKNAGNLNKTKNQIIQFSTKGGFVHKGVKKAESQIVEKNIFNEKNNVVSDNLILSPGQNKSQDGRNLYQQIYSLKSQLQRKDSELSLLRVANQRHTDHIEFLSKQIQDKQNLISKLQAREQQLLGSTCKLQSKQLNLDYGKVQYENFRIDTKRLLKMLQSTHEYEHFALLGINDGGIRFLNKINETKKSKIDLIGLNQESKINIYGCVKVQEQSLWVPEQIYRYAKETFQLNQGKPSDSELQLMIYQLNRIWRKRQKKLLNFIKSQKTSGNIRQKASIKSPKISNISQNNQKNQQEYIDNNDNNYEY